ncbi:DNA-directed RNA polymerase [Thalassospira sp. MBR-102]|uniref:DNA-directed RNA polymerase n=1 Tax=Thalassospira sp. MBR-102 TaxID=3156466 RepID=UPI003391BA47
MTATKLDELNLKTTYGEPLVARQIDLELRMLGLGKDAFQKKVTDARQKKNEAGTRYGQSLLLHGLDPVVKGIEDFMEQANSGRAGKRHTAVHYFNEMDKQVAAMLALRVVIDGVTARRTLQALCIQIGSRLEVERRFHALQSQDRVIDGETGKEKEGKTIKYVKKKVAKSADFGYRRNILAVAMTRNDFDWTPWPEVDKLHVGLKMLEIIIERTGLVEMMDIQKGKHKTVRYVVCSEKTKGWIDKQVARCELLTPQWLPTIIPPVEWTNTRDGGYHTDAVPQLPLIKAVNHNYLDELDHRTDGMPMLYEAVNRLQQSAYRINSEVLEVARQIWDRGNDVAGLPIRDDVKHVQCPKCNAAVPLGTTASGRREAWGHECFENDENALKDWKRRAMRIHELNLAMGSKRVQTNRTLWVADMFKDDAAIYFPYQLDFRGRIYAIPSFNPQGPDLMKGLLTFAEGKPINDGVAAGWLAVQGANVFGYDKASLDDRIGWVEDRNEKIKAIAEDPLGTMHMDLGEGKSWLDADKPWQFLAFCFEWAGFLTEGYGYKSSLPIALDGSCSGIQHFSAMLRDPVGGKAVNLVPSDKPSDIYGIVAEIVREKLRLMGSTSGTHKLDAEKLLALGIDRKTTKRQVMTLPYGSTVFSCREYTEQWMREERGDRLGFPEEDLFRMSQLLSTQIWDGIGETVIAARAAMEWLQGCAKIVAGEGLPITWTTPVGFPVLQEYRTIEHCRVKSKMGDSVIFLSLAKESKRLDNKRMQSAVSPNFVHSMDAAHLMMSVDYAAQNGVTHFAMIHDSFGTHAADTQMLAACLREAFVDMYEEHDVLQEFREAIVSQVYDDEKKLKIKPVPPKGTLDLSLVKGSDFFFA